MGFKDFLEKLGEHRKEKKERFKQAEEDMRIMQMLEDRQKSANERELERYMKEEREQQIKEALVTYRKRREDEINFSGNPLNVPNITGRTQWEVLKERNLFANSKCMFNNNKNIFVKK